MNKTSSFVRTAAAGAAIVLASWSGGSGLSPLSAAPREASSGSRQSGTVINVSSEPELQNAVAALTSDTTLVLAPGTYRLTSTLSVRGALTNVTITGATNNPNDVVLMGMGMANADHGTVPHGVSVTGSVHGVTIANLTIRDVFNHAISFGPGTESPRLYNLRLVDAGRQFVKAYPDGQGGGVDDGSVEGSVMEYTLESRDADTGGVHVAGGARWVVRNNRFRNVKVAGQLASPVVLMSQGSRDSIVERNTFINCQQEVAFGLEERTPNDHAGGAVRNNFMVRDFVTNGGAAIQLADSPDTQVVHNTILSNSASTSLIQYRFSGTTGVVVRNNLLDGQITARDGATGSSSDNYLRATASMFAAPGTGELHLVATATEVIDQATVLSEATSDFDGDVRPQGQGADFGADEFAGAVSNPASTSDQSVFSSSTTAPATTTSVQSTSASSSTTTTNTAGANGLPVPWQWSDVGPAQKSGSASWNSGRFTVNAAGTDIGSNADGFTYVYQTLDGDGEIVARVADLERTHPWAKAGVMFRDELVPDAKYVAALVTAEKGLYFQHRIAQGASSTELYGGREKAPQWLKLSRAGQTFTVSTSADASTWTTVGSEVVYLNKLAYVGLAVTSRSSRSLTTANFTGVTVTTTTTTNRPPEASITAPSSGSAYNTPCAIEVTAAASDPDGTVTRVDFYAGSTLIGSASRSPFAVTWNSVPVGRHRLKAVVHDNDGASSSSPDVEVVVGVNQPPVVSLTTPIAGTSYTMPASIALMASATDTDGTIAQVDFFAGETLIGSDTTTPYTGTWTYVPAGDYTITAVARDNSGATTTSSPATISVAPVNTAPLVTLTAPLAGSTFVAGTPIALAAAASDANGAISKVEFYAGSTLVGSDTTSPFGVTWTGAAPGSHTLSAKAWDNVGAFTASAGVSVTVEPASTLPSPWQTADVGGPAVGGSASYATETFTLKGAGTDVGGTSDQFRFVYQQLEGDGAIVACVTSLEFVDEWTKAGVMIRASLDANSPFAFSLLSAGWGAAFHHRAAEGQTAVQSDLVPGVAPHCVRLVRRGSTFTAYQAMDGSTWVPMGSATIAMGSSAFVGLAVTSHKTTDAAQAVLDRVALGDAPPNGAPSVSLTAPSSGSSFTAPATVTVSATASDADGSVVAVDFFAGTNLIGSDSSSPYSVTWSNVAAGSHSLTAVARDDSGSATISAPVSVTVNAANKPPSVAISAPSNGATFNAPLNLIVSATASDADGSVAKVDFYTGSTLIGSDSTSPYTATWNGTPEGTHSLTVVAVDNSGASTTSAAVSVTIKSNQAPSVSLTSPLQGATFTAPVSITLTASASDSDGTVASVEFYAGSALVGSDTTSPYSVSWSSVGAGSYTLTAVAKDNTGATTRSAAVNVTVAVQSSQPPVVSLTSPSNNASFTGPASITLAATASAADGTVSPSGLVAHWKLDEGTGTTAADSGGHNSGTLLNGASWAGGQVGGAVRLDGRSQYISLPNMDVTGSALTVTAWVYHTAFPQGIDQRIISKSTDTAEQSHYWMLSHTNNQTGDGSNRLRFRLKTGTTTTTLVASTGVLPLNTWYHAAATYDGATMRLYLNGSEVGRVAKSGVIDRNASIPVNIGRNPDGSMYLAGAIDDVRVYNAALSVSDIHTVMNSKAVAAVEFYAGTRLIGSATNRPYNVTWSNVAAGSYTLTAVARDSSGTTATSASVAITVAQASNQPPVVLLTAPVSGATYATPGNLTVSATASDADGTIATVDFYSGSSLIGSDSTSPYSVTWSSVPAGNYTLTAVARDNSGASTNSTPVAIAVTSEPVALPRYVVFNASTDHSTNVTSYTVEFFAAGANPATATPVRVQNIGKPAPVNGEISVDVAASVQAIPAGTYFSTVSANGTGGTSRSAPSETFVR